MSSIPLVAGRPRTSVLALLAILLSMLGVAGPAASPAAAEGRFIITTSTVGQNPGPWSADGFRVGASLANVGDEPVDVTSLTLSGPGSQYLRLDSGVEVPTTIANGTFRSWNYRFLPPGRANLEATITWETSIGTKTATMRFGVTESELAIAPADFGNAELDADKRIDVEVTNRGDGAALGLQLAADTPAIRFENVPSTIAAGATATVVAVVRPTALGAATGVVTATASSQPQPATGSYAYTGTAGRLVLEPAPLTTVALTGAAGGTTATTEVVIRNTGNRTVQLEDVRVVSQAGGTAALVPSLVGPLEPGQQLRQGVRITSTQRGTVDAEFLVESDAAPSESSTTVSAKFVAPVAKVAPAVSVGDVLVGETGEQVVEIENVGDADLLVSGVGIGSTPGVDGAADFGARFLESPTIAPGATGRFTVRFTPTARGPRGATFSIGTNSVEPVGNVLVTGRGVVAAAQVSPGSVAFGSVARGTSATESITVTNTGDVPLNLGALTLTGADAGRFAVTGGATPIAPGASRDLAVTFTPNALGARSASLTIASDAGIAIPAIALTGTGTATSWTLAIDPDAAALLGSVGTTVRAIAPATGTNPITFPISGGSVTAAGVGTLSSSGGLQFKRVFASSAWNEVQLDLTRRSVTARTGLFGSRSQVAVLTDVTTTPGVGDTLTIQATIKIGGVGATLLNVLTVNPLAVLSGYELGTVTITAPRS